MAITDELREYANIATDRDIYTGARLCKIADRIDERHERAVMSAMNDALYHANDESMAELGWIRLPVDADGVPIRVGDWVTGSFGGKARVVAIAEECAYWWESDGCHWCEGYLLHHYHAPTVEDVLLEFAEKINENMGMYTGEAIDADEWRDADRQTIAEFAAKLRLAGEDE